MQKDRQSTLIPWFLGLLLCVAMVVIADHSNTISVQEDICGLKKCKPYETYMKEIQEKKNQWEVLNQKKTYVTQLDQQFQNCQLQINKIKSENIETTNEQELKQIHLEISSCQNKIEEKLQELKEFAQTF